MLVPKDSADRQTSPTSRAGRWRSTRAPTSITCWSGRWKPAGLGYGDIEPVYLPPADARAAFERGAVDAWVIWDPFLAAAQAATGARTLADGTGLVSNHQFYLGGAAVRRPTSRRSSRRSWPNWRRPIGGRRPIPTERRPNCWRRGIGIPVPVLRGGAGAGMGYGVQPLGDDGRRPSSRRSPTPSTAWACCPSRSAYAMPSGRPAHDRTAADHRRPLVPADPWRRPLSRHHAGRARGRPRAICARSPRRPTISAISACCCRPGAPARTPGWWPRHWCR